MTTLRTLSQFVEGYFVAHPDEVDAWIEECFAEYREDRDIEALRAGLRLIEKLKGI